MVVNPLLRSNSVALYWGSGRWLWRVYHWSLSGKALAAVELRKSRARLSGTSVCDKHAVTWRERDQWTWLTHLQGPANSRVITGSLSITVIIRLGKNWFLRRVRNIKSVAVLLKHTLKCLANSILSDDYQSKDFLQQYKFWRMRPQYSTSMLCEPPIVCTTTAIVIIFLLIIFVLYNFRWKISSR